MKNFLKLIRWKNILVIMITMIAMRQFVMVPVFANYGIKLMFSDLGFYMLMLATVLIAAGGYVINDYFDMKIDLVNKSGRTVVGVQMPKRKAIAIHIWLNVFGLIAGIVVAVLAHRFWYFLIFFGVFVLLWVYSRYLKQTTLWGNILIAILSGLVPFLVGITEYFAVTDSISYWDLCHIRAVKMSMQVIIFFSVFAFLYTLMREIIKDCEDEEGDRENGVRSLPVVIGTRSTDYIILALSLVSVVVVEFLWYAYLSKTRFFVGELLPLAYLDCLVALPTLVAGAVALLAKSSKRKYSFLSGFVKVIMVLGIVFSIVFGHIIISNGTV